MKKILFVVVLLSVFIVAFDVPVFHWREVNVVGLNNEYIIFEFKDNGWIKELRNPYSLTPRLGSSGWARVDFVTYQVIDYLEAPQYAEDYNKYAMNPWAVYNAPRGSVLYTFPEPIGY